MNDIRITESGNSIIVTDGDGPPVAIPHGTGVCGNTAAPYHTLHGIIRLIRAVVRDVQKERALGKRVGFGPRKD